MNPVKISGETRAIGKPRNWNESELGSVGVLSVRDGLDDTGQLPVMTSAWKPSPAELEMLAVGQPILLTLFGTVHPVVSLKVGTTADLAELEPRCVKAPVGWRCTRGASHEGPCAAVPVE
jgi:hypothetical protein